MIAMTLTAIAKLKSIQVNHPEDPVVRIAVRDLDQSRLSSTLHMLAQLGDHRPAQKIGSKAMMLRASSSGATVRPKGPTGAQCCFHNDQ